MRKRILLLLIAAPVAGAGLGYATGPRLAAMLTPAAGTAKPDTSTRKLSLGQMSIAMNWPGVRTDLIVVPEITVEGHAAAQALATELGKARLRDRMRALLADAVDTPLLTLRARPEPVVIRTLGAELAKRLAAEFPAVRGVGFPTFQRAPHPGA